jgi:hypothetical protein
MTRAIVGPLARVVATITIIVAGFELDVVGTVNAERRVNSLSHDVAVRERPPRDGAYDPARDPYYRYEVGPMFEIVDDVAYEMSRGITRCSDPVIDPVVTSLRDAGIDAQRSACLRSALSVHLPISALIDTPGFHGEIDGALQLGGRYVVGQRLELSASLRAFRYQFVQNAVNIGTGAQLGPLVVGAAYGRRWGVSAVAIAGTLEVPYTRDNLDTAHLSGALTLLATNRLTDRTTLHSRLGFVGMRAWSLGGSTGRMAFRAGADVVRRLGERWSLDLGAEIQAGWYDGFDGTTIRVGAQRRFGRYIRGMLGVGLPVGGDERTNAVIDIGVAGDLPEYY